MIRPNRVTRCALTVVLAACGGAAEPSDGPVHTSLVPPATEGFIEALASQSPADGGDVFLAFDDITLDEDATVRRVAWQGTYCVQLPGLRPDPVATQFTIRFYTDSDGRPNAEAPIHTSTLPLAETGETYERNAFNLICDSSSDAEWIFYRYQADLDAAVSLSAGTTYWISIQGQTTSSVTMFGWRDGTAGNGASLQFHDGTWTSSDRDRAFSLEP